MGETKQQAHELKWIPNRECGFWERAGEILTQQELIETVVLGAQAPSRQLSCKTRTEFPTILGQSAPISQEMFQPKSSKSFVARVR